MGVKLSKNRKDVKVVMVKKKMRQLEEEEEEEEEVEKGKKVNSHESDSNSNSNNSNMGRRYEREMMSFAFKRAEWKQERKKLKEEVKGLRALLEEKDDKIREMKEKLKINSNSDGDNNIDKAHIVCNEKEMENSVVLGGQKWNFQEVVLERARRRDETVEKWKQLYLAIKMELDHLIQRTHEGGLYWKAQEEDMAEELKQEFEAREETIKELKSKLASMEQERFKREREIDILRQSLKIMSSKRNFQPKNQPITKKMAPKQVGIL